MTWTLFPTNKSLWLPVSDQVKVHVKSHIIMFLRFLYHRATATRKLTLYTRILVKVFVCSGGTLTHPCTLCSSKPTFPCICTQFLVVLFWRVKKWLTDHSYTDLLYWVSITSFYFYLQNLSSRPTCNSKISCYERKLTLKHDLWTLDLSVQKDRHTECDFTIPQLLV